MLADDDCALLDNIERIGVVNSRKITVPAGELLGDEQGCQNGHGLGFEVLEQDDFTQYIGKGRHKRMVFPADASGLGKKRK
jgi:hypothetical protein